MQNEVALTPVGDQQENLLIRISTALDALGLTVMAIKDGPGPLVIKAVNKAENK